MKTNSRINPSKISGFNFKERIKEASSISEIDSTLANAEILEGEAPQEVLYKLNALAKRKKKALASK